MKLAYFASSTIPSQAANSVHVMKMCSAFTDEGVDVTLFGKRNNDDIASLNSLFEYYGVQSQFKIQLLPWFSKLIGKTYLFGLMGCLSILIGRFDLVYSRFLFGAWLCCLIGRPVIYESHAPIENYSKLDMFFFNRLVRSKRFQALVVITEALQNYYVSEGRISEGKVIVAPDGADSVLTGKLESKFTKSNSRAQVGYVGSLHEGKGMEVIVELAGLCPWAEFDIYGGNEGQIKHWSNLAKGLDNVTFFGYIAPKDVPGVLAQFNVVLLPNQPVVRGFGGGRLDIGGWTSPLKAFEYMSAGKAILCSEIDVLKEIFEHEVNCLFCDPEDPVAWSDALSRLLQDHDLRKNLELNAKRDFEAKFSWQTRARNLVGKIQ